MSRGFQLTPQGRIQLSEKDVIKACLDLLHRYRWWPIRQHVGLFHPYKRPKQVIEMGEKGDPDYVIVKAPSFFIEFKRPGGELSDDQRKRQWDLRQFYGLDTLVIERVEDLDEWLRLHQRSP